MRNILSVLLLLVANIGLAQTNVPSKIESATVFASNAQIERTATASLKAGEQTIIFNDLSNQVDASTLRVRVVSGDVLIRKQFYKTEYIQSENDEAKVKQLTDKLELEKRNLEVLEAKRSGLLKEQDFLNQNTKVIGSTGMRMSLDQLRQTQQFYRKRMEEVQTEMYDLRVKRKAQIAKMNQLILEIKKAMSRSTEIKGAIQLVVDAKRAGSAKFQFDYLVQNAGWTPVYEFKVDDIGQPASLAMKANLVQVTGVDWNKVNLIFSTGDPQRGTDAPVLNPWYITQPVASKNVYQKPQITAPHKGYTGKFYGQVVDANTSEPLPFANVVFYSADGQVVGGVNTDFDGSYEYLSNEPIQKIQFSFLGYQSQTRNAPAHGQMDVRLQPASVQLSEVVVMADAVEMERGRTSMSVQATPVQGISVRSAKNSRKRKAKVTSYNAQQTRKATTQVFTALVPYTVKADGEENFIDLQTFELPVDFAYNAVPKLDDDAYLEAKLFGWDTLGLVDGVMKIFLEGSFVGTSNIQINQLVDTLDLSLGRDPNVVVERKKIPEVEKKGFLSNKRSRTIAYQIDVRNNKKVPIIIEVQDQFPLSPTEDIQIERGEINGGTVDDKTGIVTWKIELQPGQQVQRILEFEVTYPKSTRVYF